MRATRRTTVPRVRAGRLCGAPTAQRDDAHRRSSLSTIGRADRPAVRPAVIVTMEYIWEHPSVAAFLARLRLVQPADPFDRREPGCPSGCEEPATLEEQMDDVHRGDGRRRLRARGGVRDLRGRPMAMMFAATRAGARSAQLVLYATCAQPTLGARVRMGRTEEERDAAHGRCSATTGGPDDGSLIEGMAPVHAGDRRLQATGSGRCSATRWARPAGADGGDLNGALDVPPRAPRRSGSRRSSCTAATTSASTCATPVHRRAHPRRPLSVLADPTTRLPCRRLRGGARRDRGVPDRRPPRRAEPDRVWPTVLFTDIGEAPPSARRRWATRAGATCWRAGPRAAAAAGALPGPADQVDRRRHPGHLRRPGARRSARRAGRARTLAADRPRAPRRRPHRRDRVLGDDVSGDRGPHRRARDGRARPGEVVVSSTVRDLVVGSRLRVRGSRGSRAAGGIPGDWRLWAAAGTSTCCCRAAPRERALVEPRRDGRRREWSAATSETRRGWSRQAPAAGARAGRRGAHADRQPRGVGGRDARLLPRGPTWCCRATSSCAPKDLRHADRRREPAGRRRRTSATGRARARPAGTGPVVWAAGSSSASRRRPPTSRRTIPA